MLKPAIANTFDNSSQSWHFQCHFLAEERGVMLRVNIRRNAYDDQSFARCEAWDAARNQWNQVCSLPISDTLCRGVSYTTKILSRVEKALFEKDADRLLNMAAVIIQEPGAPAIPMAA